MNDIINIIFTLSILGSFLTLVVLILKLFIKNRFYKTWQYYIWFVVVLRFLIPIFPEITIKSNNTLPQIIPQYINTNKNIDIPNTDNYNYELSTENIEVQNQIDIIQSIKNNIGYIWFVMFIIFLLLNTILFISFKKRVFRYNVNIDNDRYNDYICTLNKCKAELCIKRKINLFQNFYISTPMLVGIFNPTILLPNKDFEIEDLIFIYKHELIHYKNYHMIVKYIVNFAVCIHWFNPLIYLVRNQINRYCELSCDEKVIKIIDKKDYKAYGNIILKIAQSNIDKNIAFISTLNGDKNILKERLSLIMNYKKITKKAVAISTSLFITVSVMGVFCGTTFASSSPTEINISNSTEYRIFTLDDLTKEEIDFFTDILDRAGESGSVYRFNRDLSDSENKIFEKYAYTRPRPKNDIAVDDKTADIYYDTTKFLFVFPDRELTEEEILQYYYFRSKMSAVQTDRITKQVDEFEKKELQKLTDKDISAQKAEEIAKTELKKLYPEADISTLNIKSSFDSKLKLWLLDISKSEDNSFYIKINIESQTGEIIEVLNLGRMFGERKAINIEDAKKTDIWKTESEKFLKDHLKQTKVPESVFSYAEVVSYSTDDHKIETLPGDTIYILFKYNDNTSYKIGIDYNTHKILGYKYERIVDINNRIGLEDIYSEIPQNTNPLPLYIDTPQDAKYLIEIYK